MTAAERARLSKELNQASAALARAFSIASFQGDLERAARLRKQQKAVADEIINLNGGPVKLGRAELLND